jgi:hypothetical protein
MPKGTDLSLFSQRELDGIADSMNNRPRATHAWHTPLEVFARTLASSHQPPGIALVAGSIGARHRNFTYLTIRPSILLTTLSSAA